MHLQIGFLRIIKRSMEKKDNIDFRKSLLNIPASKQLQYTDAQFHNILKQIDPVKSTIVAVMTYNYFLQVLA